MLPQISQLVNSSVGIQAQVGRILRSVVLALPMAGAVAATEPEKVRSRKGRRFLIGRLPGGGSLRLSHPSSALSLCTLPPSVPAPTLRVLPQPVSRLGDNRPAQLCALLCTCKQKALTQTWLLAGAAFCPFLKVPPEFTEMQLWGLRGACSSQEELTFQFSWRCCLRLCFKTPASGMRTSSICGKTLLSNGLPLG